MIVAQILNAKPSADVVTLAQDATIEAVVALLAEKKIGAVVIAGADRAPLGILSERDIVRGLARDPGGCLHKTAGDLMTADPVTCRAEQGGEEVLRMMSAGRFRHLPVVDDAGALTGLISIGDVVQARLAELSMERDALEGMIRGN